jgi:orotate phosphoribosyltransferase
MPLLDPRRFEAQWKKLFIELGAFWKHDGSSMRPHALLTSGGHSDGFFNWSTVAQYPWYEQAVANDLVYKLWDVLLIEQIVHVTRVVGPGSGAITLATRLADAVRLLCDTDCTTTFTDKVEGGVKLRVPIQPGEVVLCCEDTITSGASVAKTIAAVEAAGATVVPFILAVCNRSGLSEIGGRKILALIDEPMSNWTAEECQQQHLCSQGSEAIRPKKDDNWKLLTQSL